jgi:hypothetical protein
MLPSAGVPAQRSLFESASESDVCPEVPPEGRRILYGIHGGSRLLMTHGRLYHWLTPRYRCSLHGLRGHASVRKRCRSDVGPSFRQTGNPKGDALQALDVHCVVVEQGSWNAGRCKVAKQSTIAPSLTRRAAIAVKHSLAATSA